MKRILVFSLMPGWVGISRLPKALKQEGFEVIGLCQSTSYLAKTVYLDMQFHFETQWQFRKLFLRILKDQNIDMVVPGDDLSVSYLSQILEKDKWYNFRYKKAWEIVFKSCNNKNAFKVLANKSALQDLANSMKVLTPNNRKVVSKTDLKTEMEGRRYPVVLKSDYGVAGSGVRICNNEEELFWAYNELYTGLLKRSILGSFKLKMKRILALPIYLREQHISIQDYIDGSLCVTSLFASKGKVLSLFSYKTISSYPTKTSSSCAIKIVDNFHAKQVVERIIAETRYTGFASFDFILDENDIATLIECNARPTPVVHLSHLCGANLCAMLNIHLGVSTYKLPYLKVEKPLIALFPNEFKRNRDSYIINYGYHDVPIDDPNLLDRFNQELVQMGMPTVSQVSEGSVKNYKIDTI